jgi:L-2-amino-thiazoline-4-carboxylic acid hydrolase
MNPPIYDPGKGRRDFLRALLPAGALVCLGGPVLSWAQEKEKAKPAAEPLAMKHKFLVSADVTFEDMFNFAYRDSFIPLMLVLANAGGREKFIEILKKGSAEAASLGLQNAAKSLPKRDLATFVTPLKNPDHFWKHVLTLAVIEDSPKAFEIKVTECLWAKTFRTMNAADIGFATICFPDYAAAGAFNPKLKLVRTKTLMQGHDCCNHRYVMEV